MANRLKKFLKSFTLIELIIVIAIIAVLGVSAFLLLSQWISKGRDARKISDIQTIQKSLEIRAMETGLYPMPDGEVIEGKIDGAKLSYLGEIGEGVINKLGNITKIPQDPKTKKGYKYGVTYDGKEYEIGAVLESGKKQALIVGGVLASDLEQKVIGKYDGYITYENNNKYYIANIPSLLYNYDGITTNGADLDGNQIYYTVEGGENLLYDLQGNPVNKVRGKKIVEDMYSVIDYGVKALEITGSVSDLTPEQIKVLGGEEKAAIIFNEKPTGTDIASLEKVDGECGTANGGSFATSIEGGLCLKGTSTSVILNENKFQWSCEGVNEGATASCEASKLVVAPPEEGFSKIAVGGNFTCMIDGNKDLRCWGNNSNGIMNNGKAGRGQYEVNPVKISGVSNVKSVLAGLNHVCLLNELEELYCWGGNSRGQVGNSTFNNVLNPYKVLQGVKSFYLSREATCASNNLGDLYCWGYNYRYQIDTSRIDINIPTKINVVNPLDFSIGNTGLCYVNQSKQLYCRGFASVLNGTTTSNTSFQFQMNNIKKSFVGSVSVFALSNDNNLFVWGRNDGNGELGNNSYTQSIDTGFYTIFNGNDIKEVYAYHFNICVKRINGELYCWGENFNNQITNIDIKAKIQPVKYDAPANNFGFAISQTHSCYIQGNGEYKCNGSNVYGQLGNGLADNQHIKTLPENVDYLSNFEKNTLKYNHTFGLDEDGKIWGWGLNSFGQIGNGNYENQINFVKTQTVESQKYEKVVGYSSTKCGLTNEKKIYCWGRNDVSQLGEYNSGTSNLPILMSVENISEIIGTAFSALVLTLDGKVKAVGRRPLLGNGGKSTQKTYQTVIKNEDNNHLSGVLKVESMHQHACALTNSGFVYCWGDNFYFQVGTISGGIAGDARRVYKALKAGLNNIIDIFIGVSHSCALKNNNEIWCWGRNNNGQLGNGNSTDNYIPQKVLGLEGKEIVLVKAGYYHNCVTTSVGEMYCWGNNSNGQLGDGTRINKTTAVRVQGISNVVDLMLGNEYTCAKKDSGSLYCWGNLWKFGQLGK